MPGTKVSFENLKNFFYSDFIKEPLNKIIIALEIIKYNFKHIFIFFGKMKSNAIFNVLRKHFKFRHAPLGQNNLANT